MFGKNSKGLNVVNKVIMLILICLQFSACAENKVVNGVDVDRNEVQNELKLVREYVGEQKNKLPVNVDNYTRWVDFKFSDNKLTYIYMVSFESISDYQAADMRKYYYSKPKIDEICESITILSNLDIVYEYKYVNLKNKELITIPFNKKMCDI